MSCLPRIWFLSLSLGSMLVGPTVTNSAAAVPQTVPVTKRTQVLVASAELAERKYVAFPVLLRLDETELLVGYKRGDSHAQDREAAFELLRFNPVTQRVAPGKLTLRQPNLILQNGEFVRFANGDVACYLDIQSRGASRKGQTARRGLLEFRSADGGRTIREVGKLGVIDGIEYGYAFEAITEGGDTWMLAMTFTNLTGGQSVYPGRPVAGPVSVIRTKDNGKTWHHVKNLTREFGNLPINESSFVRHGEGFIVTTRGYDDHQWLHLTDGDFNLKRQINLTRDYPEIRSHIGRPRLFMREGRLYLLGRNYTATSNPQPESQRDSKGGPMKLSLFRFDPDSLAITRHVILDNAEGKNVTDGYYAVPYWQERDGSTLFNVITYKRVGSGQPDIVRLEFDWSEAR